MGIRTRTCERCARHLLWLIVFAIAHVPRHSHGAGLPWGVGVVPLATNGPVTGFASLGNTLYLLGSFSSVGPNTGTGVPVDPVSGRPVPSFARVNGTVYVCTADGSGGWFVGGDFTAVGGFARSHVAHLRQDGSVSPWVVDADGVVRALALDGQTLYMGGDFTHVASLERDHLAAVSAQCGKLSDWDPSVAGIALAFTTVYSILPSPEGVYVGGDFTAVDGVGRRCLAALGRGSGQVLDFDPEPDYTVRALARRDSSLYLGGAFYGVGQQLYPGLACVSTITGKVRTWGGGVSHPDYGYSDVSAYVSALAISDSSLYVAGHFTRVNGVVRGGLAAVDLATGDVQPWNPNPIEETSLTRAPLMYSLAVSGDVAYVGGLFGTLGSAARLSVAAIARATGAVTSFDPRANGEVFALGVGEHGAFVGGAFSSLGELQPRNQLAAIDLGTGALKPWNPDPGWGQVMCIAANEHTIYIGGRFTDVNGVARQNIAALDPVSGELTSWDPGAANGFVTAVSAIAAADGWVYAGGDFSTMGGLPRRFLAAIDTAGKVGPWDPEPSSLVTAICPAGSTVYVAGAFGQIGGQPRAGLAEVDTALGEPTQWNPGTDGDVLTLAAVGQVVYAGGQFQQVGGAARASLGAIDRSTGAATAWNPEAGPSPHFSIPIIRALAAAGGVLYVGGDFGQIGGASRFYAAALDTASARALDWVPDMSAGPLWSMLATENAIYFGGRVNRYGVNPAGGFGSWPAIDAVPIPRSLAAVGACYPNPATKDSRLAFVLAAPAQVDLTVFDLQGRQIARPVANEARSAGVQYASIPVEGLPPGCYLCRLEVDGTAFTRKLIVL
jgi:hypothetical protein